MKVIFFDTADRLALGNARRCGSLAELLGRGRRRHPARRRPRVQPEHVRRGRVRADEATARCSSTCRAGSSSTTPRCARGSSPARSPAPPSTCFPVEPKGRGDEFVSELRGLPNVILTPHIGGSTEEAQQDIGRFVAGKLRDFVLDGTTAMSVNLPGLALPQPPGHQPAHPHPPQRPRRHGDDQPGVRRAQGQRRGAAAGHPRRVRLRGHRHQRQLSPTRCSTSCATCRRRCGCGVPTHR